MKKAAIPSNRSNKLGAAETVSDIAFPIFILLPILEHDQPASEAKLTEDFLEKPAANMG
jgi:hypothetical protein